MVKAVALLTALVVFAGGVALFAWESRSNVVIDAIELEMVSKWNAKLQTADVSAIYTVKLKNIGEPGLATIEMLDSEGDCTGFQVFL